VKLLHAVAVSALLAGCSPNFQSITVPPPTKKAELDDEDRTIEVSKGVALAFECINQGVPCASASAVPSPMSGSLKRKRPMLRPPSRA